MRNRHTKYNNRVVKCDGYTFDSIKERQMYQTLKRWQAEGKIKDLALQPVYELQERFSIVKKGKTRIHRPITYIPDFRFFDVEQNRVRILDAKGAKTEVYRIKKKLFDWKYRDQFYIEETL